MTTPTTPAADLHDLIMNLPALADHVIEEGYQFTSTRIAYKSGHRDARHAAAELATARESALVAERDALRAALPQWLPIDQAPEGELVVVGWRDESDAEHPDRQDFDYLEDGCWMQHHDNHEHYIMVGGPKLGPGPSEKAPYTHFMRIGPVPALSATAVEGV